MGITMGGQTMPHSKNQLLARLGAEQLAQFSSHLKVVALEQGELIADIHCNVPQGLLPPLGDHLLHRRDAGKPGH